MTFRKFNDSLDDSVALLDISRTGISYQLFEQINETLSFSYKEWSRILHITERTLMRYKKEATTFDTLQSERVIEIAKLYKKGIAIFGSQKVFEQWMNSTIIALGGVKPTALLDSSFGIEMIYDTLGRLEHGVFA